MPFRPVIDQLRANFGLEEADGEPEIIAKVEDGMRRMGAIDAHIPAIRYLLAVDPGDAALSAMVAGRRGGVEQPVYAVLALSLAPASVWLLKLCPAPASNTHAPRANPCPGRHPPPPLLLLLTTGRVHPPVRESELSHHPHLAKPLGGRHGGHGESHPGHCELP